MATLPNPHVWTAGDDATSGNLQTLTNAALFELGGAAGRKPTFSAYDAAGLSIANAALTTVKVGTVLEDTDAAYSTSTGLYTVVTPGLYLFVGSIAWATNTTGLRLTSVQSSSTTAVSSATNGSSAAVDNNGRSSAAALLRLTAGQTVNLVGYQASGGTLATKPGIGTASASTMLQGYFVSA